MPELYYKDAQKLGQKEFRACTFRGEYPYLPALGDFIPDEQLHHGNDLGLIQIPMDFIVGTCTGARSTAFARNFMPLLEEDTEFAVKWKALCDSHLAEGIRDPIKAYEYMNRYYVQEGNKRVSVLKFFGAYNIDAHVVRILPEQNGSREVEMYNEFLAFNRCSGINNIEFTKPGSYVRLQELLGKAPDEIWSEEERRDFSSAYSYFRQDYESVGGEKLSTTVGDALLTFIQIYGYSALQNREATKDKIAKMWEEIALQQQEEPIEVKLDPSEKKPGLLSKMFSSSEKKEMRVAFIHDKDPSTSGWTKGHEEGRSHVQKVFRDKIQTAAYFHAMDNDPNAVIEQAIADGSSVLFTTSPRLLPASLRAAVEHPQVTILNCSLNKPHRYIRTYYARMYEAKFVIGAVAGALAGEDDVGYLCDYPIFGQVAGINAFALGVQMVNPRAKVYLEWSSVGSADEALTRLTDRGIRLISSRDLTRSGDEEDISFGLSLLTEGNLVHLATPVWQWGTYYEALLRQIQDKSLKAEYEESEKAINYFWGMSAGVVKVHCTDKVPPSTRKMSKLLQESIRADICRPFSGEIYAQSGKKTEGELSAEEIITMDWLAENVEGSIPAYEQLDEVGKATVDMVGVEPAVKNPEKSASGGTV